MYSAVMTSLWYGWIIYFAIVEGVALRNSKSGDTFSEHIWMWFGVKPKDNPKTRTVWARLRQLALLTFMIWVMMHFEGWGGF